MVQKFKRHFTIGSQACSTNRWETWNSNGYKSNNKLEVILYSAKEISEGIRRIF